MKNCINNDISKFCFKPEFHKFKCSLLRKSQKKMLIRIEANY